MCGCVELGVTLGQIAYHDTGESLGREFDMSLSIRRAHLLAQLNRSRTASHLGPYPVLICAPAGYGKTSLVNEWLANQADTQVVRVRCIAGAKDTFWTAMLDTLVEAGLAEPCAAASDDPFRDVLRVALALESPLILTVDDYHLATSTENDLALLDLISPQLSLVLVARRVTVLDGPLAARRTPMIRIGIAELAFTPDEAQAYCEYLGLPPSTELENTVRLAHGWPLAIRALLGSAAGPQADLESPRSSAGQQLSPLAAIRRFAQHHLDSVSWAAGQTLIAATIIEVIDLTQIAGFAEVDTAAAQAAAEELIEQGLLLPAASGNTDEFSLHPIVRQGLISRAERLVDEQGRAWLMRSRANRIKHIAPFAALELYIRAREFSEAECVLAHHFVTITDEGEHCLRILYQLPDEALSAHPTFIAARLFLLIPDVTVSPEVLWALLRRWRQTLARATAKESPDPQLALAYATQSMVATRAFNNLAQASELAVELEASVVAQALQQPNDGFGARQRVGSGSYPIYFLELASTVLATEDIDRARRIWDRLISHSDALIAQPWYGFPSSSTRTVTDTESGQRWRLAALNELALTEALDGDMVSARRILADADAYAAQTGVPTPGLAWVSGEMVRAWLASELHDPELLHQAAEAIAPVQDRIERWRLFAIAELESIRYTRGTEWALSSLESLVAKRQENKRDTGPWRNGAISYHALLCTTLGKFEQASRLLDHLTDITPNVIIERARIALFTADYVEAVLVLQQLSPDALTKRQCVHYLLIVACAAWRSGEHESAVDAFVRATELISEYLLTSTLWNVPYETLVDIADAAQASGRRDAVELIASVPERARARNFPQLTEMEHQTLATINAHPTINDTAEVLFVTPATVKKHLNSVYRKLSVKNREEALFQARLMGIIPPAEHSPARG